jgi:hypothetical protein
VIGLVGLVLCALLKLHGLLLVIGLAATKKRLESEDKASRRRRVMIRRENGKLDEGDDSSLSGSCPRQSSCGLLDEDDEDRDANDRFCRLVVRNWWPVPYHVCVSRALTAGMPT